MNFKKPLYVILSIFLILTLALAISSIFSVFLLISEKLGILESLSPAIKNSLDNHLLYFYKRPAFFSFHIGFSGIYTFLGVFQLSRIYYKFPLKMHLLFGKIFIFFGIISAITGELLAILTPAGGIIETIMVSLIIAFYFYALYKALYFIKRHKVSLHRNWMIRAFFTSMTIVSLRFFLRTFEYLELFKDKSTCFNLSMFMGFILNILMAESLIWSLKKQK